MIFLVLYLDMIGRRIYRIAGNDGFLGPKLHHLLVMVGASNSSNVHFFPEHEAPFYDYDLLYDRDDNGIPFLTNCRHFIDRTVNDDILDLHSFVGQEFINEMVTRSCDGRYGNLTSLSNPPTDLELFSVKLKNLGIQRLRQYFVAQPCTASI